jgi:hypothetical protein
MVKRNKPLTETQKQAMKVNDAAYGISYGSWILLSCANAAYLLLQEEQGFTQEAAQAFVHKMIARAVQVGAGSVGVDITGIAEQMAEVLNQGSETEQGV